MLVRESCCRRGLASSARESCGNRSPQTPERRPTPQTGRHRKSVSEGRLHCERQASSRYTIGFSTSLLHTCPHLTNTYSLSRASMDLMKAGESIMRSSQSLMPFLAPTAYTQPARRAVFSQCRAQPMRTSASRSFATSVRRCQDDSASSGVDQPSAARKAHNC